MTIIMRNNDECLWLFKEIDDGEVSVNDEWGKKR
jgi:hypothetical protein